MSLKGLPVCLAETGVGSKQAFDNLEKYLALTAPPKRPSLEDCNRDNITPEDAMEMATYSYNACINVLGDIYGPSVKVFT